MGNDLLTLIFDEFQFEKSIKQTKKALSNKYLYKKLKSSPIINGTQFFKLYQALNFEKKKLETKKTSLQKSRKQKQRSEKNLNIINLSKNFGTKKNTLSFETKKIKKKSFSVEKNLKKLLKYKKAFEEYKLKENQLKIYIKNNNELLLSEEEFNQSYSLLKKVVTKNKTPVDSPVAITLGGQPGAGKSNIYEIAKKRFSNNIVELDCDAFRIYHPYYKQIKNIFGKDDANKTNPFVFKAVDLLIEELSNQKYNLIIESSLNSPNSALENGKTLPPKGYKVELHVMATPKKVSWQGTIDRYNKELKKGGNPRAVPKEFHDKVVENICKSLDIVKKSGLMSNILLFDRNKNCLYDMKKDKNIDPCLLLYLIINGFNPRYTGLLILISFLKNKLERVF